MLDLSHSELKHLREGGALIGDEWLLSCTDECNDEALWLCGTTAQVSQLIGQLPPMLHQMIDASEKLLFSVQTENGPRKRFIADLDGALGEVPMKARRPICWRNKTLAPPIDPQKTLPLQTRFEVALSQALKEYKKRFTWNQDGTFKIEPSA